ncbi:hypothetical protein CF326_g7254 [Tilletia indica]|nr:hypothetical protein CF326_g7254 [Tilletia indica]
MAQGIEGLQDEAVQQALLEAQQQDERAAAEARRLAELGRLEDFRGAREHQQVPGTVSHTAQGAGTGQEASNSQGAGSSHMRNSIGAGQEDPQAGAAPARSTLSRSSEQASISQTDRTATARTDGAAASSTRSAEKRTRRSREEDAAGRPQRRARLGLPLDDGDAEEVAEVADAQQENSLSPPPSRASLFLQAFDDSSPGTREVVLASLSRRHPSQSREEHIPAAALRRHQAAVSSASLQPSAPLPVAPTFARQSADPSLAQHPAAPSFPQRPAVSSFNHTLLPGSAGLPSGLVGAVPHMHAQDQASASFRSGAFGASTGQDPDSVQGFNPTGVLGAFTQFPPASVLTKVASSQFIPLWHFTKDGMSAGHEKALSLSVQAKKLLENLGSEVPLVKERIPDSLFPFELFFRAAESHVRIIRHVADCEVDPVKAALLRQEADIWNAGYSMCVEMEEVPWFLMVKYIAYLREQFYARPVGRGRINPALWQPPIWNHVLAQQQMGQAVGAVPFQAMGSDSLMAHQDVFASAPYQVGPPVYSAGPSSYHPSPLAHQPGPPAYQAGPSGYQAGPASYQGVSSAYRQPRAEARGQLPPRQRPFRSGPQGEQRSSQGAPTLCVVCGRTRAVQGHDFKTCQAAPAGTCASERLQTASHMNALCAVPELIMHSSADLLRYLRPDLVGHRAPLSSEGFEKVLRELGLLEAFQPVVDGIAEGFDFGIPPITSTKTPPNHASARENEKVLRDIARKEVEKGRWAGPYTKKQVEELLGPFQSSPMGVIPKPNGKFRPVQDFSFPRDGSYSSINEYITSDEFLTAWDGANATLGLLNSLPNTVQGATMDASEAFRACRARLSQLAGLVVMLGEDEFYIDFFLGFGLASATGVWGMVGDCVKAILEEKFRGRVRVLKWVDDFLILRLDPAVSVEEIMSITAELDFPWNPEKTVDFSPQPKYIGWLFDIAERKVILPRDKAERYATCAVEFQQETRRSLKEAMQLLGCLQHVATVARDLRPYLSEISAFIAGWKKENEFQNRFVTVELRHEATHWVRALSPVPFVRSFAPPPERFPETIWVDASTEWGIGIVVGQAWSAWKWRRGWDRDGRGIGWAEAIALELGMLAVLEMGGRNSLVDFRSDNQGVLNSYKLGHNRLLLWRPGFDTVSTLTLSSGDPLPNASHLHLAVGRALGAALEASTRAHYGSAIGVFIRFCFDLGLSIRQIFPISEGLLLAFVSAQAGSRARGTVSNYLAALAAWHESWGRSWVVSPLVGRALQGVAKLAPDKKALRAPVQLDDLLAVRTQLDTVSNPLHSATWACALMSFWSACRLGETTCPSASLFNPARHVSRSAVGSLRFTDTGAMAVGVQLPWTKTTKRDGMTKVLSSQAPPFDPISALFSHLSLNSVPNLDSVSTPPICLQGTRRTGMAHGASRQGQNGRNLC